MDCESSNNYGALKTLFSALSSPFSYMLGQSSYPMSPSTSSSSLYSSSDSISSESTITSSESTITCSSTWSQSTSSQSVEDEDSHDLEDEYASAETAKAFASSTKSRHRRGAISISLDLAPHEMSISEVSDRDIANLLRVQTALAELKVSTYVPSPETPWWNGTGGAGWWDGEGGLGHAAEVKLPTAKSAEEIDGRRCGVWEKKKVRWL